MLKVKLDTFLQIASFHRHNETVNCTFDLLDNSFELYIHEQPIRDKEWYSDDITLSIRVLHTLMKVMFISYFLKKDID